MKKILIISLVTFCSLTFMSCNDSFLDKTPVTGLTEKNTFTSYDNFKAFTWPCYEMFIDKAIATCITDWGMDGFYKGDMNAGYLESKYENGFNKYAYQTVANASTDNGWSFTYIRRINIILSHINESAMTDKEKEHWRAVGLFFHSYWYMELINRFGDIPWIETALDDSSPEMYQPRESRDVVADKVMERLKWAEEHIGNFKNQDGNNTIDVHCVRAALSRFTLREGTWRKNHDLEGAETYLT